MKVNDELGMPPTATEMRVIVLLLVSICLSTALGLAMLIAALAPASVAAPSINQFAPCGIAAVSLQNHSAGADCPTAIPSSTCCIRRPVG
ncbi:hypothetical protein [Mycolicibacterium gadium]|uniref:Uncharacterized protein n=1 Tax=Mycolicibacterium gadium TaxID=1794 RepID=A0A7I7WJB6_MYCGU|nr:hypothetical protein [Mycolicibacterium gadium]BBZ17684.1 hypothetical protein MGAD_20190 [Mycolicibacterium gadium]